MSNVFVMYLFKSCNNLEEEVSCPLFRAFHLIIIVHCRQEVEEITSIREQISLILEGHVLRMKQIYLNDVSILTDLFYHIVLIEHPISTFDCSILLYQ